MTQRKSQYFFSAMPLNFFIFVKDKKRN